METAGESEFESTMRVPIDRVRPPHAQDRLAVLVVLRGAQVGRRYLLNERSLVIGRRGDRADLVVQDALVSSAHCRIERTSRPDSWAVVDLASTNGTLVGGQRVTNSPLRDGDRIEIGDTVLKFCFHDALEDYFHRQVDHLMNIDDLTGLPVQRVFRQRFDEALQDRRSTGAPLVVFMMDLDGLKRINDQHGHQLGAHSIATVGRRLGGLIHGERGVVSRFGGDEFSAFVPALDRDGALTLGERMRAAVADEPIALGAIVVNPTISIGFACAPGDGQLAEQLTRHADEALYRAKAAGRNRVCE
jgi:diguanylate cyclase (GGDEF)-like protein